MEDDDVEKEEDDDVEEDNVEEEDDKDEHVAEDEVDDHDVAEDEVEDDDVEDDDVKGEKDDDLMLRRRKMIMLRMMRLRRKTGPKTGKHTLCEPEWSKSMSTCHKRHQKSHFRRKFTGKMRRPRFGPERRRRLCASLRSRNACQDFTRATLSGNLQVEYGKMPQTRVSTLVKHRPVQLPQEPLSVDTLFGEIFTVVPFHSPISVTRASIRTGGDGRTS